MLFQLHPSRPHPTSGLRPHPTSTPVSFLLTVSSFPPSSPSSSLPSSSRPPYTRHHHSLPKRHHNHQPPPRVVAFYSLVHSPAADFAYPHYIRKSNGRYTKTGIKSMHTKQGGSSQSQRGSRPTTRLTPSQAAQPPRPRPQPPPLRPPPWAFQVQDHCASSNAGG